MSVPNTVGENPAALAAAGVEPLRWGKITSITLVSIALYVAFRALPTGTNLHSADFDTRGKGMVEMCDPANPQFVAVTTARSPVTMTLRRSSNDAVAASLSAGADVNAGAANANASVGATNANTSNAAKTVDVTLSKIGATSVVSAQAGEALNLTLSLATSTGKPVGPADLLEQHTRKLHLLVIDPTLRDYQHIHPEPGKRDGDWTFSFTPRLAGTYRVFADFVPVPTARSLYAAADLNVNGDVAVNMNVLSWTAEVEGYHFALTPAAPVVAGKMADLTFTVTRPDGGAVPLEPVMDAYAHLVAFDQSHSGFAHLHPQELSLTPPPDAKNPKLTFKITIPQAGVYVIWAQVKLSGHEVFAPFWFEVK